MITGKDIYDVIAALVPLYVAIILAYGSVRWWKIFTPDQCSGINRFVAVFAIPVLSFDIISTSDPYSMNYKFIAADSLQKIVILVALFLWKTFSKSGSYEWMITLFSLSTLPNTLVMGLPLLKTMYGDFSGSLMVQIVVLQGVIWNTVLLILFEYRATIVLISERFPNTAGSITSFLVDSDVVSLNDREPLEADAEIDNDGKLHVVLRKSSASSSFNKSYGLNSITSMTPRASNLTSVEIYSVQSSREATPRVSSFNQADYYTVFLNQKNGCTYSFRGGLGDALSLESSQGSTSRNSNFDEEMVKIGRKREERSTNGELVPGVFVAPCPPPTPMFPGQRKKEGGGGDGAGVNPVSEGNQLRHEVNRTGTTTDFGATDSSKADFREETYAASRGMHNSIETSCARKSNGEKELKIENGSNLESGSAFGSHKKVEMEGVEGENKHQMPPASVMTRLILIMVWRKLIRNPNTYSSLLGLVWSLIAFKWDIKMPSIISGSISILSDTGLGMAVFGLGLFMALQPKIIACGKSVAAFSMAVRFLIGPAVMATTATAIGIRGVLLDVAIVQASLPQGIVPFVFAKEYNVHPNILSTSVIFGMLITLPISILYFVLLGL